MGWKIPSGWDISNYSLYTFSRLTAPFCISEFKRRASRTIQDYCETEGAELKARVYADYMFMVLIFTGIGWPLGIVFTMLLYSLSHDWKSCGGRSWVWDSWATMLYGATKPVGER